MKILIVENDEPFINAIKRAFREFRFVGITSVKEALSYVAENPPTDLVMLDLRMNGKNQNGFIVYESIRKLWGFSVPIAIVTGCLDDLFDRAESLALSDTFLRIFKKPLDLAILESIFAWGVSVRKAKDTAFDAMSA